MASVFKPAGKSKYKIEYTDEHGRRRKATGATDKAVSERIAHDLENTVALRRHGLIDPAAEKYRDNEIKPLAEHIADWQDDLVAQGFSPTHAEQTSNRVRRLIALMRGSDVALQDHRRLPPAERGSFARKIADAIGPARLSDLNREKIQDAIAKFKSANWSLQSCNHYRAAARAFSTWAWKNSRIREDLLRGVTGFNAKEDPRHDRRTIALDELRRLIEITASGPEVMGMPGPARSLCYRLAVGTGLRYEEIASVTPESFDWEASSVTVTAAYTKNGDTATLTLPGDLVDDLAAYVSPLAHGTRIFPLPPGKGAKMLRHDLKAAGIPYRDASGLVFDFHSLRCELATLADAAGVSPRVVQKMMRHSTLELTGRYTRPRAVDIEAAAGMLPSLKPEVDDSAERAIMTGIDCSPLSISSATENTTLAFVDASNSNAAKVFASMEERSEKPQTWIRAPPDPLRASPNSFGLFVYRLEDAAFSRQRGGFDSLTGYQRDR
jgi:integrase